MNNKNSSEISKAGSALLLTVMIIAIISSTTLASIAVRFDQLSATDKIANSAIAKSAADSGLAKLKEAIEAGEVQNVNNYDLETDQLTQIPSSNNYRPSPRKIVTTYEKSETALPRCLAVAVLSSWVNDGKYLFSDSQSSNPAMIFNYANIVNDTPLGIIPGNENLGGTSGDSPEKQQTLSNFTNMGHFYNPYAPVGSNQNDLAYWTVKLGGPNDQFLTRKSIDGKSSYYKELDFVYIPYLPRFQDSGLAPNDPGSGLDRLSADQLKTKFETVIKENNFKVWLDASVDDTTLSQYGFGDLFSGDYRINWLQPAIWNDTPEADIMAPYTNVNADSDPISWSKQELPLRIGAADAGWQTSIIKGSKSFSFIKLSTTDTFTPGASRSGLLFGSLEGLRLNQKITLTLLNKSNQPLSLKRRSLDQGKLYNAYLTNIGPKNVGSNGIESINVTFTLGDSGGEPEDDYNTPPLSNGSPIKGSDIETIAINSNPQFTTNLSNSSVALGQDGTNVPVTINSNCAQVAGTLTACPAVGDLVSFSKSNNKPLWGKVVAAEFTNNGATLSTVTIDKLREGPKPLREMASAYFTSGGAPRIAYYGGAIAMNDYDGGYASEGNELWVYDPENKVWSYPTVSGTSPGKRAGASMVFDSQNNRLVTVGGYYHEAVGLEPVNYDCERNQPTCLYTNRPGLRVAKRVTNDVFAYKITNDTAGVWEKVDYTSVLGATDKIVNGTSYTIRTTSTLADRSGLEGWNITLKNNPDTGRFPITLTIDGTSDSIVSVSTSLAGISLGDRVYLTGTKTGSGEAFYSWATITALVPKPNSSDDYSNSIIVRPYGYQPKASENQSTVSLTNLAIQVTQRQDGVTNCAGVKPVLSTKFSCNLTDSIGFSVGDSVVLEEFSGNQLTNVLSGYIYYLTASTIGSPTSSATFVSDERLTSAKDFSETITASSYIANESPVKLPTMRYGANLSSRPLSAPTQNNAYSQGAAKNINNYNRVGDIWNLAFTAGQTSGPSSAVWSINPINTDVTSVPGSLNFQVIRSPSFHQISTTNNTSPPGTNPELKKTKEILDRDNKPTGVFEWDNDKYWVLEIDDNDVGRLSVGAQVLLEKRSETGARLTWHGIIPDYYKDNSNSQCGAASVPGKMCLKHNSSYPNDSEFLEVSKRSANSKVSLSHWINASKVVGAGIWLESQNVFQLTGPTDKSLIPPIGSTVMLWSTGAFPIKAYTIVIKQKSYTPVGSLFKFTPTGGRVDHQDKLLASPPQNAFMTTALATNGATSSIVTIADNQLTAGGQGAPEWFATIAAPSEWKVRLATKNTVNDRPSPRRAGSISAVSFSNKGAISTYFYVAGGTFGSFATLWRQTSAEQVANSNATWKPQFVSAQASADLPNLAGGSLVAYNFGGLNKLVWLGGKQKTDFSSKDYGQRIGPFMLGKPDIDRFDINDNSFYMDDSNGGGGSSSAPTWGFTHSIESNLSNGTNAIIAKSLSFRAGGIEPESPGSWTRDGGACPYLGQSSGCHAKTVEQLMSNLGMLGRIDGRDGSEFGGGTWGKTNIINSIGARFLSSTGAVGGTPTAILTAPSYSGSSTNGRWDQDGYRPYLCDKSSGIGLSNCSTPAYGQLSTSLSSDKTAVISAFSKLDGGGALLVTANGIGKAIASNRGGSTKTAGGWYSYCAKGEIKLIENTNDPELKDGLYQCKSTATRYMPTLPDPEDMLFALNAAITLSSVDTYKVVGYYGGIKRGYQVISRTGLEPVVYEIVP